jgi:hypothetical protein
VQARAARALTPPDAPTVTLNEGDTWANTQAVSVAVAANGGPAPTEMCLSWTSACSAWTTYAPTASTRMPSAVNGVRTLRVWLRDADGNTSAFGTDAITLDTVKPTNTIPRAEAGAGTATVSWTPPVDALSGVTRYRVMAAHNRRAPTNCAAADTPVYIGTETSFVHRSATAGTWAYRVCAEDAAGNVATGATTTAVVTDGG